MVHWLRVCFAVPGTQVRSLVWEDPTSHGATKSEDNNKDPVQPNLIKNQQNIKQKKISETCIVSWGQMLLRKIKKSGKEG